MNLLLFNQNPKEVGLGPNIVFVPIHLSIEINGHVNSMSHKYLDSYVNWGLGCVATLTTIQTWKKTIINVIIAKYKALQSFGVVDGNCIFILTHFIDLMSKKVILDKL
jgi:hypothetical protein